MKNLKTLIPYMKKHKLKIFFTILLMLIISIISMLPAKLTEIIIDKGFTEKKFELIVIMSISLLIVYITKSVLSYLTSNNFMLVGSDILNDFRTEIYEKIFSFGLDFFSNDDSAYLTARINETSSISSLFSTQTFGILVGLLEFVFALIIMISINAKVLLIMCIPMPIVLISMIKSANSFRDLVNASLESNAEYSGKINEVVSGIENIKGSNTEELEVEKLKKYNYDLIEKSKKQSRKMFFTTELMGFLNYGITIFLYIVGGYFVVNDSISIGLFFSFSMYIGKLYAPLFIITTSMITIQPALSALERTLEFLKEVGFNNEDAILSIESIDKISFDNVYMKYSNSENIISNLSFEINKGDKCLLVGKNGSGKSTVLKLILKLYSPCKGDININNINIKKINASSINNKIAYVPQKIFLFNDTIKNNILYGLSNYSMKTYEDVIKKIKLDEWFLSLPQGDDTVVGANAFKLSGGQIQKIAIARAIIKNVDIYIFDEFMSHLDSEVSGILKMFIEELDPDKTVIIVDHRDIFTEICNKTIYLSKKV